MTNIQLCERIETLLDNNNIQHIEYNDDATRVSCRGTYDDMGCVLHLLYTNNLNDNTTVKVIDDNASADDDDDAVYFDIIANV